MPKLVATFFALVLGALPAASQAQEAVVPASNVEALFTDKNPKLRANKQVIYHIMKDLLEAGHWDKASLYLTERYIQHNPNVASGRANVVSFFQGMGIKPKPVPARLSAPVVQVIAQGDIVTVALVSTLPHPKQPGRTYTTTWFDMFRIRNGKADEHWDSAPIFVMPN
ncbi:MULTISPECIES: nuclear transport factor 2 family protein [unclassified Sphingomonas]|uniref:nuclear transport factor 2 family protein n=1 Tax=Novosphingobium rhizosphaerae TaxID=1551649 RepID=UPI0015CC7A3B